jgi:hypothetical protein
MRYAKSKPYSHEYTSVEEYRGRIIHVLLRNGGDPVPVFRIYLILFPAAKTMYAKTESSVDSSNFTQAWSDLIKEGILRVERGSVGTGRISRTCCLDPLFLLLHAHKIQQPQPVLA